MSETIIYQPIDYQPIDYYTYNNHYYIFSWIVVVIFFIGTTILISALSSETNIKTGVCDVRNYKDEPCRKEIEQIAHDYKTMQQGFTNYFNENYFKQGLAISIPKALFEMFHNIIIKLANLHYSLNNTFYSFIGFT